MFYVIGNDMRQKYIKEMLQDKGEISNNIEQAEIVICATPFLKDGKINGIENTAFTDFLNMCINKRVYAGSIKDEEITAFRKKNISIIDYMKDEALATYGAISTAEGVISLAISNTECDIFKSNILILGFGKCGKILADRFKGLKANVFCEARNEKDLAIISSMGYNDVNLKDMLSYISKMDVIINTVPAPMITKKELISTKSNCLIVDIASHPGGVDFEMAKKMNIKTIHALSIPSKVSPKSSAKCILQTIQKMEENI